MGRSIGFIRVSNQTAYPRPFYTIHEKEEITQRIPQK